MPTTSDQILDILTRYKAGRTLTDEESALLAEWIHTTDPELFAKTAELIQPSETISTSSEKFLEAKLDRVDQEQAGDENDIPTINPVHRVHFLRRLKWIAAAVILFAFAGGVWVWVNWKNSQSSKTFASISNYKNDVAPGKKGGKLKLSDNRILSIDSLKDGFITTDAGLEVYKENGRIVYKGTATETAYNEIIEETGRFTAAELPDHSTAWVASNSSIRYPLRFADNERKVTMTGQAAFKVIHNEEQPFRVYVEGQVFEDKGTVFNIRAYKDEPLIKTTVMEGLVSAGNAMIRPSQQAQINRGGRISVVDNVNVESVFAWRDGEFTFSNASIEDVMTEAARWYGVEVVYKDQINQRFGFVGIDRNMPISNLLRNLEIVGGIHFDIDGKKVTVKK